MEKTSKVSSILVSFVVLTVLLFWAGDAGAAIENRGVMENISNRFITSAGSWANLIKAAATRLFWTLALISMVWTFGMMALRKADIGEFFAEFVRFIIFTGFFWWLLENGPAFADSIINSLVQLGESASSISGYSNSKGFTPSQIVDIGFIVLGKTFSEASLRSPFTSLSGIVLGLIILGFTAMIAVNMLLLVVSGWILSYAGIFLLGFGGARWTSDIAINYYKAVLGIAIELMTMVLLVGIGVSMINEYYAQMEKKIDLEEMAVITVVIFTVFLLSNKLPRLLSGVLTGASVGGNGIGSFGAGAAMGAAMAATGMAAAGARAVGGAMLSGAAGVAGGASAVKAAYEKAQADMSGGDMPNFGGGGAGDSSGGWGDSNSGDEDAGTGDSPFARAAGLGGHESSGGGAAFSGDGSSGAQAATAPASGESSSNGQSGGDDTGTSGGGEAEQSKESSNGQSGADDAGQVMAASTESADGEAMSASATESGGEAEQSREASRSGAQGSAADRGGNDGFFAALAQAGRVTAGTAGELAKGAGAVAKAKAADLKQSALERIADTTGGKIASAIRAQSGGADASSLADDKQSWQDIREVDPEAEVAAFRDRKPDSS